MRTLSADEMQITGGGRNEGCGKLTSFIVTGCAIYGVAAGYARGGWGTAWATARRYANLCRRFCGS